MANEAAQEAGPKFSSRAELKKYYEDTYGRPVVDALEQSIGDRKKSLDALSKSGLNGKAEGVMKEYLTYEQEFARQDKLNETWMQKGWRKTKETAGEVLNVAAAPFRFAWRSFKKHPVLTTLAVTALAVGGVALGAYLTGNLEGMLSKVGLSHLYGAQGASEAAKPLGKILDGGPSLPEIFTGSTGIEKL